MEPIIEKSVNGRTICIYEVEIEYQIARLSDTRQYESDLANGRAAEPPNVQTGAYTRLFDQPDVPTAINEAVKKFEAFVQGQAAWIKSQVVRRCDLKFRGHAF